jgi:hypothetical protein
LGTSSQRTGREPLDLPTPFSVWLEKTRGGGKFGGVPMALSGMSPKRLEKNSSGFDIFSGMK